jgi:hypothetical protein
VKGMISRFEDHFKNRRLIRYFFAMKKLTDEKAGK